MPWWGWITIGALMLAAELAFVDAEFYLVFLGVSALLVGALDLSGIHIVWWAQWLAFAVLSVGSLVVFRQRVYVLMRPPPEEEIPEGVDGDVATALEDIEPRGRGRVELRGSHWTAINEGDRAIASGERCSVSRSEGLTVHVRAVD
jgi:membrane protein implicated in regulation of membrane protease activity